MTDTTQPHPEPSEEASSLPVVAYRHLVEGHGWMHTGGSLLTGEQVIRAMGGMVTRSEALTPLADAQSQLNAMRVERDAAREHLARSEGLLAIAIKQNENADRRALKAAQKEGE